MEVIVPTTGQTFKVKALLDSACTGSCIHQAFVDKKGIIVKQFDYPIAVYNTDGTENTNGKIMSYVDLDMIIDGHKETRRFAVTNLNHSDIFIEHDWLQFHNLEINWTMKSINFTRCPPQCNMEQAEAEQVHDAWSDPVELEEGDQLFAYLKQLPWSIRQMDTTIWAFQSVASKLAEDSAKEKPEEVLPEHYGDFQDVFDKEEFDQLPPN